MRLITPLRTHRGFGGDEPQRRFGGEIPGHRRPQLHGLLPSSAGRGDIGRSDPQAPVVLRGYRGSVRDCVSAVDDAPLEVFRPALVDLLIVTLTLREAPPAPN